MEVAGTREGPRSLSFISFIINLRLVLQDTYVCK